MIFMNYGTQKNNVTPKLSYTLQGARRIKTSNVKIVN